MIDKKKILYRLNSLEVISNSVSKNENFEIDRNEKDLFFSIDVGFKSDFEKDLFEVDIYFDLSAREDGNFSNLTEITVRNNYTIFEFSNLRKGSTDALIPYALVEELVNRSISHTRALHYDLIKDTKLFYFTIPMMLEANELLKPSMTDGDFIQSNLNKD